MQKKLWIVLLFLLLIGCNDTNEKSTNSNIELPSISSIDKASTLSKQNISDIEAIKSQDNTLSFAYYTANKLTKEGNKRWYISQINGGLKGYVFSLMPIVDDTAGWGEISNDGATLDIYQENITIDYIADNPTYEYKDWGLGTIQTDSIIQEDIELIRNSTVDVKWWFFKASNNDWYIVNTKAIYKFASSNGIYDWQKIEMTDLSIDFFVEDGLKKMKITSSQIEEVPQLNLNHKSETLEILKRNGCNFTDISQNMFSSKNNEENYITAICQAGIMQGDEVENTDFKPFQEVHRFTVAKVTSLVYSYEEVKKFCSQSIYHNSSDGCYIDFAKQKGLITTPIDGTLKRSEFYIYLTKLFWNKNTYLYGNNNWSIENDAWSFLKNKGVFNKEFENLPAIKLTVPDFQDQKLLRWELVTLVMRCSRLSKEETPSIKGGELPYSITPDNKNIDDTEQWVIDLFSEILGEDFDMEELFDENKSEEREEAFFIPKNSLPKTPNIKETSIDELPNAIVKTVIETIGKKSPFTDGKNTIDTRLITTVYGQDVKYESAKEMCEDYEAQGKLEEGLPTDRDLKGSVVCYNNDTPGTNGKGHVAIITDSKGDKEVGVQDTKNGVMERPTDKANIKGVIAPQDIDLPNF